MDLFVGYSPGLVGSNLGGPFEPGGGGPLDEFGRGPLYPCKLIGTNR